MSKIASTLDPPYYAVIFTSQRTPGDEGYAAMAQQMEDLASQQPGFLGIESVRGADGFGITVSYWKDVESIRNWKAQGEHRVAQAKGRQQWYSDYFLRMAKVERNYGKT